MTTPPETCAFNSLHNVLSFLFCAYARVLACMAGALQAACVGHVLCVMTERRGGGCALLSGIVLILLNDYLLRPEREEETNCVGGTCRQMSRLHPLL